jgi:hypothetical protein
MIKEQFLKEVEDFLRQSGMRHTAFGKQTMGDFSFVTRLRNEKKDVTSKTIENVRRWMRENAHLLRQAAE